MMRLVGHQRPVAHVETVRCSERDDRTPVRCDWNRYGTGERPNPARPGPSSVDHPAGAKLSVCGYDAVATPASNANAGDLDAAAALHTALAGVAQIAPQQFVHVDVPVLRQQNGAVEVGRCEDREPREHLGVRQYLCSGAAFAEQWH